VRRNPLSRLTPKIRQTSPKQVLRIEMEKRHALLTSILEQALELTKKNEPLKAIFDLDSTLFDVSFRIAKIMHDFAATVADQYPEASKKLLTLVPDPSDFGVKKTLMRLNFEAPNEEFIKNLVEYWKRHFFSSDYLYLDQPYPGAKKYVNELHQAGAEIYYLTGRDIPGMLKGTIDSLKFHGFPIAEDHTNLVLKPSTNISDHDFKKDFFKNLDLNSKNIWFFENEPTNIHLVNENSPHINIVFVNTVHSGKAPEPGVQISRIPGFIEIL
jgi:hypothetical protein